MRGRVSTYAHPGDHASRRETGNAVRDTRRGRVGGLVERERHAPVLALLVVLELVLDHADDDVVAHEPASVHDLLRRKTELRLARDLVAQHVARGEVAHTELFFDERRLRALACDATRPSRPLYQHGFDTAQRVRRTHLPQEGLRGSPEAVALASWGRTRQPSPSPPESGSCRSAAQQAT